MKFVYIITLKNGRTVRVVSAGDPTRHPSLWGRVLNVETLGIEGQLLSVVSDPSDMVYA